MALSRQQQRLFGKIVQRPTGYRVTTVEENDAIELQRFGMVVIDMDLFARATTPARLGYYIGQDEAYMEAYLEARGDA